MATMLTKRKRTLTLRGSKRRPDELRKSDFWETTAEAFKPEFLRLLPKGDFNYGEPCYGNGALVSALSRLCPRAKMRHWSDKYSLEGAEGFDHDARTLRYEDLQHDVDLFITNPPWRRYHLFPIIKNLTSICQTWLLLPSDFMHRQNASPYMEYCSDVVPIGPIAFVGAPGKPYQCYAWYLFHRNPQTTILHRRVING